MAKYRFDQVARECRTTFKGDKNGMPIVGLEHLVSNEMLVRDFEVDTENTFTKSFKQGQILFGRRRAYQQKAGVAQFDGICSGDITVIEAIPGKIEPNLLPFIVQNEQFFEHAVQGSAGSLSPRVKWEHLASYEIELPTMEKQRVLADKLWTAYRLKESYKKLLAATDEMVKSQFIEMFGERTTTPVGYYIKDSFPGDWGKEDLDGTGVKVIRTTNFTNFGKLNLSEVVTRSIEERKIQKKQILKYDTILERSGGTADNPVGRVVLFEEDEQYLCNNFTQVLRFKDIDPRFAFYALFYFYQMNKTSIRSMGSKTTGIQNLNMSKYLEIGIPNADEDEQKQFVSIAEQADKSKFVGFKSQFIEMFGDPMTNTKGWTEYGYIGNYSQIVLGSTPNSKNPSYWDGDIKWITPAEMTDESYYIYDTERHLTEEGLRSANLTLLPYGSVLFSTRAPIGKVGLVGSPMYCNQGFKNFICNDNLNPVYLYYTLIYKHDYLVSLGTGTTFKELSKKAVDNLEIAIPPLELQEQFECIYHQSDKSKFELRKSTEAIDRVIKSLINNV